MDRTAASDTAPVEQISWAAAFHSASGTASFSRTSTDAWWMESPITCTVSSLDASWRRSCGIELCERGA